MSLRRARARHLALGLAALLASGGAALGDPDESFKKGIEATDRSRWSEAAEWFRQAIAEDSQESERRVFLSGVFSRPYLPHLYLGWSLSKAGPEHCEAALEELEISEAQGVVSRFRQQMSLLAEGKESCTRVVLPAAIAAAALAVERAAGLSRDLGEPLADAGLEARRGAARADLEGARESLRRGQDEGRLSDLEEARRRARVAAEGFTALLQEGAPDPPPAPSPAEGLEAAVRAAEREIAVAETARRRLADLLREPRWREALERNPRIALPATAEAGLDRAKRLTAAGKGTAEIARAQRLAVAAAEQFAAAEAEARDWFATWLAEGGSPRVRPDAAGDPPDPGPTTSGRQPGGPTPPAVESRGALDRRLAEAEELLAATEGLPPGPLLTGQRRRLEDLLREARGGSGGGTLEERLVGSTDALRLVAAAGAFLAGKAELAISLLEGRDLHRPRWSAQAHLFLAAARFSLYRRGAERDLTLLDRAAADVRRGRRLDPALQPDRRAFSPPFRQFFALHSP